jgi:hypothetical protein
MYICCLQVMECGWDKLLKEIDTAESLEDVILVGFIHFVLHTVLVLNSLSNISPSFFIK